MKLLTPKEYMQWKKVSRQNFWQKVKRGTIDVVYKDIKVKRPFVPVDEQEFDLSSTSYDDSLHV